MQNLAWGEAEINEDTTSSHRGPQGFAAPNYFQTPNDFIDHVLREVDTLSELKVTLAVFRKTFGWQKRDDDISLSQLQQVTGMGRSAVVDGTKRAVARGTIKRTLEGRTATFSVDVWFEDGPEMVRSADPPSPISGPPDGPISGPTKDTVTKDTHTKDNRAVDPAFEPDVARVWAHYCEVFDPPRAKLGPNRARGIKRALEEVEVEDLLTAIDGLHAYRATRQGKTNLETIWETYRGTGTMIERIQFFISQAPKSSRGGTGLPSADRATIAQRQLDVQRGHRLKHDPEAVERAKESEAWLVEHGIETVKRERDGYPTFRPARLAAVDGGSQ